MKVDAEAITPLITVVNTSITAAQTSVDAMNAKLVEINGIGFEKLHVLTNGMNFVEDICWESWCVYITSVDKVLENITHVLTELSTKEIITKKSIMIQQKQRAVYDLRDKLIKLLQLTQVEVKTMMTEAYTKLDFDVDLTMFNSALTKFAPRACITWLTHVANTASEPLQSVMVYNISASILGAPIVNTCDKLIGMRRLHYTQLKHFKLFRSKTYDTLDNLLKQELAVVRAQMGDDDSKEGGDDKDGIGMQLVVTVRDIISQYHSITSRELCVVLFDWESKTKDLTMTYSLDNLLSTTIPFNAASGVTEEFTRKTTTMAESNCPRYVDTLCIREVVVLNGPNEREWRDDIDVIAIRPFVSCGGERLFQTWGLSDCWKSMELLTSGGDQVVEQFYNSYNAVLGHEFTQKSPDSTSMMYRADIQKIIPELSIQDIKIATDKQMKETLIDKDVMVLVDNIVNAVFTTLYTYMKDMLLTGAKPNANIMGEISLTFNISVLALVRKFRKELVDFFRKDNVDRSQFTYVSEHRPLIEELHKLLLKFNNNIDKVNKQVIQKYYTLL